MGILFTLLVGVLLLITNPTSTEFEEYVSVQVTTNVAGKQPLSEQVTRQLLGGFVSKIASEHTERANYFLFSVYNVDMSGLRLFRPELPPVVNVLAIGGQFIPLTKNPVINWQTAQAFAG